MRIITRTWHLNRRTARVLVTTRHPQVGDVDRGTIHHVPSDGLLPAWQITDMDGVDHGTVTGHYIDAEKALLDATAALDARVPAEDLADLKLNGVPVPTWTYTINIADVWKNPEMTFEERRDAIVRRLRASRWLRDRGEYSDIHDAVEELADVGSAAKFDEVWSYIYDEADADRAWIAIS